MNNPIYSLISMIDEPDPVLFEKISDSITSLGSAAIPVLEDVKENTFDNEVLQRLEKIIQSIHAEGIANDIQRWKTSGNPDLLQFLQILSKYHSRNLDMIRLNELLTAMQKNVWLELNENLTSLECIRLINHFVFQTWGLVSDETNMLAPDVFFLNQIIEDKKAHPVVLGAFYLAICQRLSLPVFYVGLPDNFILSYTRQPVFKPNFKPGEILFYINPLLQGVIFNRVQIDRFLENHKIPPKPGYYEALDNLPVAALLLKEMQKIYVAGSEQQCINDLQRFIDIVDSGSEKPNKPD
jgi:hypothetical protein